MNLLTEVDLNRIKFLNKTFYSLIFHFSKRISFYRDFSNKFFDSIEYYEKFNEYLQDFIDKLRIKVDFSSFLYFYYRISLLKDIFLSSNVIYHLFNCPRSYFIRSYCKDCCVCYSTKIKQPSFISDGYFFLDSNFIYELHELRYKRYFKIKIFYRNFDEKEVVESDIRRCLTFKVFKSKHDIYIAFVEVLSRILFNSFYSIVEDFEEKEDSEIFISLFHDFYEKFIKFFNEATFGKSFFRKIFHEFELINYNTDFIKIINDKYLNIVLEKRKQYDKNKSNSSGNVA